MSDDAITIRLASTAYGDRQRNGVHRSRFVFERPGFDSFDIVVETDPGDPDVVGAARTALLDLLATIHAQAQLLGSDDD